MWSSILVQRLLEQWSKVSADPSSTCMETEEWKSHRVIDAFTLILSCKQREELAQDRSHEGCNQEGQKGRVGLAKSL